MHVVAGNGYYTIHTYVSNLQYGSYSAANTHTSCHFEEQTRHVDYCQRCFRQFILTGRKVPKVYSVFAKKLHTDHHQRASTRLVRMPTFSLFALFPLPSLFECLQREAQQVRRVTDILGALVSCSRVVGREDVSPEGTFPTVRPRTSPSKTCQNVAKVVLPRNPLTRWDVREFDPGKRDFSH